jgi:naphthalene 1,2-dioxygenase system ferredoxin subunit
MVTTFQWIDAAAIDDIPDGDAFGVVVQGRGIALYRVSDTVYATAAQCTHGAAQMCDGFLEGYEIECPLHQGRFDIRTGKALNEPLTEDLKTYAVRCENGRVLIAVD